MVLKPTMYDHNAGIGGLGESPTENGDGVWRLSSIGETVRVEIAALRIATLGGDFDHVGVFRRLAILHDSDGDGSAAIESVDEIDEGGCIAIVLADGDGEELRFATRFERVDHREREGIVHIVAHIGIEDEADGRGGTSDREREEKDDGDDDADEGEGAAHISIVTHGRIGWGRNSGFKGLAHFVFGAAEGGCGGEGPGEGVCTAAGYVFRFGQTANGGAGSSGKSGEDFGPRSGELGNERHLCALLVVGQRCEVEWERLLGEWFGALPLIGDGQHDGAPKELQERLGGGHTSLAGSDAHAAGEAADRTGHCGRELRDLVEGEDPGVACEVEELGDSGGIFQDWRGGGIDERAQKAHRHTLAGTGRALDGEDGDGPVSAEGGEEPRLGPEPVGVGGGIDEGPQFVEGARCPGVRGCRWRRVRSGSPLYWLPRLSSHLQ